MTSSAADRVKAIGAAIALRDEQEIDRAKQLVLPIVLKQSIPKMYVLMDGVQIPVVAAETVGRSGRTEGQRARTRECKLGAVFTQTTVDEKGWARPLAQTNAHLILDKLTSTAIDRVNDPDSTTYVGAIEIAEEFGYRIYRPGTQPKWSTYPG